MIDENESMDDDHSLLHYGIKRRSGRYPWGSGKDPFQRSQGFKAWYDDLKSQGLTDKQIYEGLGLKLQEKDPHAKFNSSDLRYLKAQSAEIIRNENMARAIALKNKDVSTSEIGRMMGVNESTVRGWLKGYENVKEGSIEATTNALKAQLDTAGFLDVGAGTNLYMGISDDRLKRSLAGLKDEGYEVYLVKGPQLGTDKMTEYRILCPPGSKWEDARSAYMDGRVRTVIDYSDDGGLTFKSPRREPVSMDSKRIEVAWAENGGAEKDGIIEMRRGVADLDLKDSSYAQVRIAVDGTHFMKGMAVYVDDLPAGVDIRYNSNKSQKASKLDAMKPMEADKGNPFGAITHPKVFTDKNGKEQTSLLNVVGTEGRGNEEGRWDTWSKNLASQMLSKQSLSLAQKQLGEVQNRKAKELAEIQSLTNPVVKQKLLDEFALSADSAALNLQGAAIKGQATRVLLPMNSMRTNEIYAPGFENGSRVALVRYPHGGVFEIPDLTVNNNNRTAKKLFGQVRDAVGIHHKVAEQLSGADFDGDSVIVIPNDNGRIKTSKNKMLPGLENFDPKAQYHDRPGMTRMTKQNTQKEMGMISNLITDMTIHGAPTEHIVRAVRHSMVVIDAEKHKLDYKQSAQDNNIKQLKELYQDKGTGRYGASTIISLAKSRVDVPQQRLRKASEGGAVDPETGKLVYVKTGASYQDPKTGETKLRTMKERRMNVTDDARTLSSGQPMEEIYASHANALKSLANQARKDSVNLGPMPRQSSSAKAIYKDEVASLKAKLDVALRNAPLERRAQQIGNAVARAKVDANPGWDKDRIKKVKYQALDDARTRVGANKARVEITPREWDAIQSKAVSSSVLKEILRHADMDKVKEYATPRPRSSLTPGQMARAKAMMASGNRSLSEVASALGIPRSTLADNLGR